MGAFTSFVNNTHSIRDITTDDVLVDDDYTLVVKNDASNILIGIGNAELMIGREIVIKRGENSTGQIIISPEIGEIEELNGAHSSQTTLQNLGQVGSCQKFQASPCGCWLLVSAY